MRLAIIYLRCFRYILTSVYYFGKQQYTRKFKKIYSKYIKTYLRSNIQYIKHNLSGFNLIQLKVH